MVPPDESGAGCATFKGSLMTAWEVGGRVAGPVPYPSLFMLAESALNGRFLPLVYHSTLYGPKRMRIRRLGDEAQGSPMGVLLVGLNLELSCYPFFTVCGRAATNESTLA
jgi:hypothetical protein